MIQPRIRNSFDDSMSRHWAAKKRAEELLPQVTSNLTLISQDDAWYHKGEKLKKYAVFAPDGGRIGTVARAEHESNLQTSSGIRYNITHGFSWDYTQDFGARRTIFRCSSRKNAILQLLTDAIENGVIT